MTQNDSTVRRAAGALAVLAAAAVALAGCSRTPVSMSSSADGAGSAGSPSPSDSGPGAGSGGTTSGGSGGRFADFPVRAGNIWVYRSRVGGKRRGTVINEMTKVTRVPGGKRVTMLVTDRIAGTPPPATQLTYIFHADGSITVPLAQISSSRLRVVSGKVIWPGAAQLASGRPYRTTLVLAASEGTKVTRVSSHVTVRGGGMQTVRVPAGKYHAQVIDETVTEKVGSLRVTIQLRTWVARGVGPVKTALFSGSATPTSVEVLKSFRKA
jgi:hypothetical protein